MRAPLRRPRLAETRLSLVMCDAVRQPDERSTRAAASHSRARRAGGERERARRGAHSAARRRTCMHDSRSH
eukprot:5794522-Pleurochrysis_carterae.AAC.2